VCSRHLTHFNGGEQTNQKIAVPRSIFRVRNSQITRIFSNELNHAAYRHGSKSFDVSHGTPENLVKMKFSERKEKSFSFGGTKIYASPSQPLGTTSSLAIGAN